MKLHTVAAVLVVLSCIASVGVASTTLETSLSSNPDDVVDLNYDILPINPGQAEELRQAMTGENGPESESLESSESNGDRSSASTPASDGADGGSAEEASRAESASSADEQTGLDADESWVDWLLAFLRAWLPLFVGIAIALAVSILLASYGGRLVDLLTNSSSRRVEPTPRGRPDPQNAVEHAWLAVLTAADVDDPWRRTPAECAAVAVENGFDPEGVERLRRVFEEVRYGGCELTESRRRRMENGLSRLDDRAIGRRVERRTDR